MEFISQLTYRDLRIDSSDCPMHPAGDFNVQQEGGRTRIELRPNSRNNKKALVICVAFVSLVAIAIAIMFALFGAWLILPFAGLEILLLAISALIACSHTSDADLLVISQNYVHLTQRRRSGHSVASFFRQWTKIALTPGKTGHEPVRLLVINRAQEFEIGEFLLESSKIRLFHQLTEQVSK